MSVAPAPVTFGCGQCGAALRFAGVRTAVCPFCASASVLPREAAGETAIEPAFTVAFTADAQGAVSALRQWVGSRSWFTDRALRRARVEDVRGVYVPAYLYSAVARTAYTAQIGEHFEETETYQVRVPVDVPDVGGASNDGDDVGVGVGVVGVGVGGVGGGRGRRGPRVPRTPYGLRRQRRTVTETRTRTVTRTEHRLLRGRHLAYVSDVLVSASVGLAHHELARLAPFELGYLRRYAPALVAGFVQEDYSRSPDACERASRAVAAEQIASRLHAFLPGDSAREIEHTTTMQWESLDPVLVPVWIFALRYRADRPPLRVLLNGQTHAVVGRPPLVWWKILVALLAIVAAAVAIAALWHGSAPA